MEEEGRPHSQQRRAHGGHALGGDGAHLVKYGKYSQYSKHSKRSQCCRCSGHTLRSEAARARVSGGEGVGGEGEGRRGCADRADDGERVCEGLCLRDAH